MPLLSRRLFTLTTLFGSPTRGSMASSSRRVIDSAVHVWSTGREPFPWAVPPPPSLAEAATPEALIASAAAAGVAGALIVQPANHMFDHKRRCWDFKTAKIIVSGKITNSRNNKK